MSKASTIATKTIIPTIRSMVFLLKGVAAG